MSIDRSCPEVYEDWWLEYAMKEAAVSDLYELAGVMEKHVSSLSDALTLNRSDGFAYHELPMNWLAYGLFFFPQNYMRMMFILEEVSARFDKSFFTGDNLKVMDLGSGTGAATFALLDWLKKNRFKGKVEVTCVDQSAMALKYSKMMAGEVKAGPAATTITWLKQSICSPAVPSQKWDIIMSSYALNEAFMADDDQFAKWTGELLGSLNKGGILLVCEPMEYDKFNRVNALRDRIIACDGMHVIAPCLHDKACPMMKDDEGWCHDVRSWHPTESMRLLNRRLYRKIELLKYSFIVAGRMKKLPECGFNCARMIAPVKDEKGRSLMKGCAGDGTIRHYEVQDRALSKEQADDLDSLERGDVVDYQIEKELRNGKVLRVSSLDSRL